MPRSNTFVDRALCLAGALLATGAASCFSQGETTCGQEASPRARMTGRVVNGRTNEGLKGSIVTVELCGLYTENPDPAKAHPNYRFGTLTRDDGTFEVEVPQGKVGLHTFLPGFRYGFTSVQDSTAPGIVVVAEPLLPGDKPPKATDFRVTPAEAAPGQLLEVSVNARSAPPDPLSEELVILLGSTLRAMAPPRRGVIGVGFPDGQWTATINAPTEPGKYKILFGFTSEYCIVGDQLSADITVR